jgi:hypothetical protein
MGSLAEDRGFEPLRALTQHAFQACALGHYANPPSKRIRVGSAAGARWVPPGATNSSKGRFLASGRTFDAAGRSTQGRTPGAASESSRVPPAGRLARRGLSATGVTGEKRSGEARPSAGPARRWSVATPSGNRLSGPPRAAVVTPQCLRRRRKPREPRSQFGQRAAGDFGAHLVLHRHVRSKALEVLRRQSLPDVGLQLAV